MSESYFVRRLYVLFLVMALMVSLCGCGGNKVGSDSSMANQNSEIHVAASSTALEQLLVQDKDGANAQALIADCKEKGYRPLPYDLPEFLTPDQQQLYDAAFVLYHHFSMSGGFSLTQGDSIEGENGWPYDLDKGFASYADFYAALEAVFTPEFVKQLLEETPIYIEGPNGKLYSSGGDRGGNIAYQSSSFEFVSQSDERIEFNLVGQYDDTQFSSSGYKAEGPSEETFPITLEKTEAGWRFANFELAF